MECLRAKYWNFFSFPSSLTCLAISSSLMASDTTYMLTTSICISMLDFSTFTPTYPSKIFTWMSTRHLKTKYSQNQTPTLSHPANLLLPVSLLLANSNSKEQSCPNQSPFPSLCPSHTGLLNVPQSNQRTPPPQGLCAYWLLHLECPCPRNQHDSLASLSLCSNVAFKVRLSNISSYPALFFFRAPDPSNIYLFSLFPN